LAQYIQVEDMEAMLQGYGIAIFQDKMKAPGEKKKPQSLSTAASYDGIQFVVG
jgi:hypothetical protein